MHASTRPLQPGADAPVDRTGRLAALVADQVTELGPVPRPGGWLRPGRAWSSRDTAFTPRSSGHGRSPRGGER